VAAAAPAPVTAAAGRGPPAGLRVHVGSCALRHPARSGPDWARPYRHSHRTLPAVGPASGKLYHASCGQPDAARRGTGGHLRAGPAADPDYPSVGGSARRSVGWVGGGAARLCRADSPKLSTCGREPGGDRTGPAREALADWLREEAVSGKAAVSESPRYLGVRGDDSEDWNVLGG
jgi:hypothetical protein